MCEGKATKDTALQMTKGAGKVKRKSIAMKEKSQKKETWGEGG
jgi:hypothetical protein